MSETAEKRADRIPLAEVEYPLCGACGNSTEHDGNSLVCYQCGLGFDSSVMTAFILDPDAPQCGASCDNAWHGTHKLRQNMVFNCYPCALTEGHESLHFTGCKAVIIKEN